MSIQTYDGTYTYALGRVDGYTTSSFIGLVTVSGHPILRSVTWRQLTYSVDFVENGFPTGMSWSVNLGLAGQASHTIQSTDTIISASEPNGTYSYSVGAVHGWNISNPSGTFVVNGLAVSTPLTWNRVTYAVTFLETGLGGGTVWSVTFNRTTNSSVTADISFPDVPNGTYSFAVKSLMNTGSGEYIPTPASGSVIVYGKPASLSISFEEAPGSPTNGTGSGEFLGLPAGDGYALIGLIAAVVVVGVVFGLTRSRKGRNPPGSEETTLADGIRDPLPPES